MSADPTSHSSILVDQTAIFVARLPFGFTYRDYRVTIGYGQAGTRDEANV